VRFARRKTRRKKGEPNRAKKTRRLGVQAGRQAGWLDEDYFWNGEDIDFCYKLKENGWQVVYIPEIKITHYKGASAMATKDTRLAWAKNSTGVMSLFYRKHLAQKYPFFVNWSVYLGIWILKLFRLIRS